MQNRAISTRIAPSMVTALFALLAFHVLAQSAPLVAPVHPRILKLISATPANAAGPELHANNHFFGVFRDGDAAIIHELTLGFDAATTITSMKGTPDFRIQDGGSCQVGSQYGPQANCTIRIAFTPKGPGHRTGKLTVEHTASARPENLGLLGESYLPAVSFVPAIMTTVPSTYNTSTKKGLIGFPYTLAMDGGDNLYIADQGKEVVDIIDSRGALQVFAGGGTETPGSPQYATFVLLDAPSGLFADLQGDVYFGDYASGLLMFVDIDQYLSVLAGEGNTCTKLPCPANSFSLRGITGVVVNSAGTPILSDFGTSQTIQLSGGTLSLYSSDPETADSPLGLSIDTNGNLYYSAYNFCQVRAVSSASGHPIGIIAGSRSCGYSGDGGQARSAELYDSQETAQDAANNLYIADTDNSVIRRVDWNTGVIHTIAGVATKGGYSGDNGPATSANLNRPLGVSVDSNGSVYVSDTQNGVIRKIGPNGILQFSGVVGVASAVQTISVTDAGNASLSVTQAYFSGPNAGDFTVDPHTTSCNFFSSGGYLGYGQSCQIGISFKASQAAAETAQLILADNTALTNNVILLNGTGEKQTPQIAWPAPAAITTATPLSATQLDAKASYGGAAVAGSYVYSPPAGTTLAAGVHTLKVTFTPTNTSLYNTVSASVSITVNKVTPAIAWPTPAAVTTTTPLSTKQLNAAASYKGAPVSGTFVYTPAAGSLLTAGTHTLSVTFKPSGTAIYNAAPASVKIVVKGAKAATRGEILVSH